MANSNSSNSNHYSPDKQRDDDEDDDFVLTKVSTDLYLCTERRYKSWNVANIWIVQGTTMDLIIDTGIGLWDLPAFLIKKGILSSSLGADGEGSKPFQAVATHVHFDHSGGLHQFPQFAIHEEMTTKDAV
jgi:glyoxylase-like metal-dependent hydrolase (beta-lactamase superfamily II)